jgi:hypothetical protein
MLPNLPTRGKQHELDRRASQGRGSDADFSRLQLLRIFFAKPSSYIAGKFSSFIGRLIANGALIKEGYGQGLPPTSPEVSGRDPLPRAPARRPSR